MELKDILNEIKNYSTVTDNHHNSFYDSSKNIITCLLNNGKIGNKVHSFMQTTLERFKDYDDFMCITSGDDFEKKFKMQKYLDSK